MQLNMRKSNNPIKNWAEDLNRHFSKEDRQRTISYMKKCSTSLIFRELKVKTTMRYHLILLRMAIIKMSTNNKNNEECRGQGILLNSWWKCKLVWPLWKTVWKFLKKTKIEVPYDPAIPLLGLYPEKIQI